MFKKDFGIGLATLFIGIAIITGSYFIGNSIKTVNTEDSSTASMDSKVLSLLQVAQYLNMTEEEVKGIIKLEKDQLDKTGSFSGRMFPYFTINNNQYFYKDEIDEWFKEASSEHREYNTIGGWIL